MIRSPNPRPRVLPPAREAAIGIRFSAALRTLARTLLGRVPAGPELIAVHLRLEEDCPRMALPHPGFDTTPPPK